MMAMEKFSKVFEAISVSGSTRATLSSQSQVTDWSASPQGKDSHFPWPAKREDLSLTHQGTGKPWATLQSLAAIPLKEPLSSGYKIKRTVIPMERKDNNAWSRGDILRVRLEVEAQADQTWVVVSDPVPAGATILGSGLGRDSQLLSQGEEWKGMAWLAYEERSFEAYRAYYEYVPKGKWVLEYTLRLNQSGVFQLPTTRVEALVFSGDVRRDSEPDDEDTTLRRTYPFLTGKCPVSPALEGGVEGHNIKEVPYREASPFRAWSFTLEEARGGPRPGMLSKR